MGRVEVGNWGVGIGGVVVWLCSVWLIVWYILWCLVWLYWLFYVGYCLVGCGDPRKELGMSLNRVERRV